VIHGILHLQGFDHITDEDASVMEELEIRLLAQLGFSNPYEAEETEAGS
ncbi:rRNA maturation RNase YbeY, partial [Enterococcus hirae]